MNVDRHIESATAIAKSADADGYHFGAVIFSGKRVSSVGWCQCKSHPRQAKYMAKLPKDNYKRTNNWLHAEIHALVSAKADIEGHDIVIARWANGSCRDSLPCAACQLAISAARLRKIWFWSEKYVDWICKRV